MASACIAVTKEESIQANVSDGTSGTLSNTFMEETQGYDVEFDPPLESKYECPICLMALREAVQARCGHRFCKACIAKSIRDAGQKCPIDNEILLENHLFPDNFAKREILSLTVKCPNKGCNQKMELRHLEDHELHCGFASEKCPQCQGTFPKNQLQEHMKLECSRRRVACPNCALSMPYEEKKHQAVHRHRVSSSGDNNNSNKLYQVQLLQEVAEAKREISQPRAAISAGTLRELEGAGSDYTGENISRSNFCT